MFNFFQSFVKNAERAFESVIDFFCLANSLITPWAETEVFKIGFVVEIINLILKMEGI